ncbi:MAG: UbiA prenyltransferase family protein [Bacteroidia bacterium]
MIRNLRHLSIDVALGASSMMGLVAAFLEVEIDNIYYFLLFLITWLIYTTDHLMDARNIPHEANTPRHRFHQKHYKPILTAAIVGFFVFIVCIPRHIGEGLFHFALVLSGLVLLYFLSLIWARKTQFRYVLKELFIALCYTVGVSLVPVSQAWPVPFFTWLLLFRIFMLALSNLFLFSMFEIHPDIKDKHPSAIKFLGINVLNGILHVVLPMQALGSFVLMYTMDNWHYPFLIFIMNSVLMVVFYFPKPFKKNEWYRVLGDGVFLVPGIYFIIERTLGLFTK